MPFVTLACMLIAVDGDTLRCGEERIRLLGIDAPELPGHCAEGRQCAPGDPFASKVALETASRGMATIERVGRDVYDRTLARIRVNGVDLSCSQIAAGHAIYRPDWDQFALVGTDCGLFKLGGRVPAAVGPRRSAQPPATQSGATWSYRNCAEARRAGAVPLRRGTPGYGPHMDGDGDGVACEPIRR
ncbi:thermonuclease family protein [Sphingomonas sp. Leaf4]|uniref:thermonuclease family protein n=1 Tax=Sphingomonas sp. Leaf4 TaxID=2876553 RepID=UPI001E2E87DB|nr:thermonuclease family protein [Sphingomonas sp. Leaf4]